MAKEQSFQDNKMDSVSPVDYTSDIIGSMLVSNDNDDSAKIEVIDKQVENIVNTKKEDTPEVTGTVMPRGSNSNRLLSSWDPRLGRQDAFLAPNDTSNNKSAVIIPFATQTAASAYYNMVFSVEKGIKDSIKNG